MRKADRADRQKVTDILVRSFEDNGSVNYVVKQDGKRLKRIRALMEYSFDCCIAYGRIYLNDAGTACALVAFPDRKRTTPASVWRDVKLVLYAIGLRRVRKMLQREAGIKAQHPQQPFCYLWYIGVAPEAQGRGAGGQLLKEVIEDSNKMNRPVLLETSVRTNIAWYERTGFRVYHQTDTGYRLYFLNRNAG